MKKRASQGLIILTVAGVISKILSIIYVPILRVILGNSGMGIYSRSYEVFIFAYSVATMGCQPAVVKVISEFKLENLAEIIKESKKIFLKLSILCTIGILLVLYPCVKYFKIESSLISIIFLLPAISITTLLGIYRGYFQSKNKMKFIGIAQILEQFLNIVFSIFFAIFLCTLNISWGSAGATLGTTIGAIIAVMYLRKVFKKNLKENINNTVNYRTTKKIRKHLIKYAFPIATIAIIQNLGGVINMLNINKGLLIDGLNINMANSLYAYLYYFRTLLNAPMIIITSISLVFLPIISRSYHENNIEKVKQNIIISLKIAVVIAIPAAFGLALLSKDIYILLFNGFGFKLMLFGSGLIVLMAILQVQNMILQSINEFKFLIISISIGMIANLIITYFLVRIAWINIYGVLVANAFLYIIPVIMNMIKILKVLSLKKKGCLVIIKPLIAGIMMFILLEVSKIAIGKMGFINNKLEIILELLILTSLGIYIYVNGLLLFKGINQQEINYLPKKIKLILNKIILVKY